MRVAVPAGVNIHWGPDNLPSPGQIRSQEASFYSWRDLLRSDKNGGLGQAWHLMLVIPALKRWREDHLKFKSSLGYIVTSRSA